MTTPLSDERIAEIQSAVVAVHEWGDHPYGLDNLVVAVGDLLDEVERLRGMLDRVAASDQAARASDRKRGELLVEAACRITELEEQNARWQVMVDRMAERAADNLMRAQAAERRVAELVAVLREVEWEGQMDEDDLCYPVATCPNCDGWQKQGHAPDCALDAALRGADE